VQTRSLGRTGLKVTPLCLGTMTFGNQADEQTSFAILDRAFSAGVRFIDTADMYPLGGGLELVGRTETIVGHWLAGRRQEVVLATKCFGTMGEGPNDRGLSRKHVMQAVEDSLRRLGTDYLDLYQAHQFDETVPLEETLEAFSDLVRQGKVRYVGVSNWRAWQVAKAMGLKEKSGLAPIASVQPRYNLLFRMVEDELVPYCREAGIGIIPYNPLAGGLLTGRYRPGQDIEAGTRFALRQAGELYRGRYWHEPTFSAVERYRAWCQEHGRDLATTAVQWVLCQPGITAPILGASRPEQLEASLRALEAAPLSPEDLAFLNTLWFDLPRRREAR